jgi:hypothetical protein
MTRERDLTLSGKDFFTVEEAAAYACVSPAQFRAKAIEYGIRSFRFMGRVVYRRADIARAMEQEFARQWPPSTRAAARGISSGPRTGGSAARV